MTRDASLDEFLGDDGDDGDDGGDEDDESGPATDATSDTDADATVDGAGDGGTTGEPLAPADAEPARSTYAWSPAGAACAACGATVTARWRDGDRLVCPDCKDWAGDG